MEKRISMLPHKPHATSQPSRFSHTPKLSSDSARNQHSHSLAVASLRAKADLEPAWCSCAHVVVLYGPTKHSTAKEASQRTVYRRSAQKAFKLI